MFVMAVIMSNYSWPVCPRREGITVKRRFGLEGNKRQKKNGDNRLIDLIKKKKNRNHGCPQLLSHTYPAPKSSQNDFFSVPMFFFCFFFYKAYLLPPEQNETKKKKALLNGQRKSQRKQREREKVKQQQLTSIVTLTLLQNIKTRKCDYSIQAHRQFESDKYFLCILIITLAALY